MQQVFSARMREKRECTPLRNTAHERESVNANAQMHNIRSTKA